MSPSLVLFSRVIDLVATFISVSLTFMALEEISHATGWLPISIFLVELSLLFALTLLTALKHVSRFDEANLRKGLWKWAGVAAFLLHVVYLFVFRLKAL